MSRVTDPRCHVEYIYTYIEYGRRKAFLFVDIDNGWWPAVGPKLIRAMSP